MPKQFDIYRVKDGVTVVVVQADILEHLPTRVVIPLVSSRDMPFGFASLMPVVMEGDTKWRLFPQQIATVMSNTLEEKIGSAAHVRDDIIRATDMLLTGY